MPVRSMPRYFKESWSKSVHICLKIRLNNGTTLLFDDHEGAALGSDGKKYYPVCRELPGPEGDCEVLGWSSEAEGEVVLE
ncbi:hypothetical protein [Acutalibacter sp. 1XD8-36]|uniref:hypothetical protein n=1 Tax=Acutalibacter sp. 1XD8-36 TaxID=2320852 RepID=UPI00261D949D|nr:hypothetical protein [Acutalibacter sp. 1XD8-36]